ncbi:alkaline phosphatase D family protein [Caenimonas aquaedulcis]|uniref:Alkaline phosphatase D family protein n=1 Tax=Caenimonas aquaedulcis TaxID=2793270 RepID=A0A931H183_9BURK|nr:alkaline phosphatase D family protein [Caenimonas aquaedulcis]MBG9386692.1 alkaline phosphatase D family protein [Caenimonas aquaedulcis]
MKDFDTGIDRRSLLQWAGTAASTLWLPRAAWSQAAFAGDPFALGIASGSPLHDSVVLWTRLANVPPGADALTVQWEMAHDEGFTRIVQRGQAQALAALGHSVHVEAGGLEPDRWYFYRFMAGGATSPVGRTRTFPAPDAAVQSLRLAYASCQRWEHGYFSAYRHMREENLDAVVFLGDYIYEYPTASKPARTPPGTWVTTLADYRDRYALHKSEADLRAMHAACPWIVTWDDHEVQNDYAGLTPGDSGPQVADFAARRAAAYQAFYENMPVRASALTRALAGLQAGAEMRLYSRQRLGRLGSLIVLDDRQYRDAQVCSRGGKPGSSTLDPATCAAWNDPARTLLGAAQESWLDGTLAAAGEGWTIVAQQSLFGRRDFTAGPGQSLWNDGWDGYAAARTRFTQSLQKHRVANPVLLGGDVHENWVGHVMADYDRPDSATLGVELCGTSITSRSGGNAKTAERIAENPHFVFADAERKGYGVAEFTPSKLTATLRVVDDVTRPDTKIETLARFAVAAGSRRLERA